MTSRTVRCKLSSAIHLVTSKSEPRSSGQLTDRTRSAHVPHTACSQTDADVNDRSAAKPDVERTKIYELFIGKVKAILPRPSGYWISHDHTFQNVAKLSKVCLERVCEKNKHNDHVS
jgi:1,4-alpha-glucan branching enzyme